MKFNTRVGNYRSIRSDLELIRHRSLLYQKPYSMHSVRMKKKMPRNVRLRRFLPTKSQLNGL